MLTSPLVGEVAAQPAGGSATVGVPPPVVGGGTGGDAPAPGGGLEVTLPGVLFGGIPVGPAAFPAAVVGPAAAAGPGSPGGAGSAAAVFGAPAVLQTVPPASAFVPAAPFGAPGETDVVDGPTTAGATLFISTEVVTLDSNPTATRGRAENALTVADTAGVGLPSAGARW